MFPLVPLLSGAGLVASLFGNKQEKPRMPQYFYSNPQELIPLIRQSVQSGYGGAGEMLREELANAGLFGSSGYATEFGKLALGRGQQESSAVTDFLTDSYKMERGAQLGFEGNRYFDTLNRNERNESALYGAIGGFGKELGGYFGEREARKRQDEVLDRILGARR